MIDALRYDEGRSMVSAVMLRLDIGILYCRFMTNPTCVLFRGADAGTGVASLAGPAGIGFALSVGKAR